MIRAFRNDDLLTKFNEFTQDYVTKYLNDIHICDKRTLEVNGKVQAVICFNCYEDNNYTGFFLIANDFNPRNIVFLKNEINKLADELKAERLETLSLDDDRINRWHKSLGFELEGTKRKFKKGKDFNIWAMLWGTE